jgi:hippurate hydrolase
MRRPLRVFTALVLFTSGSWADGPATARYRDDLADDVAGHVRDRIDDWLDYYKDLHAHPELSLQERESAKKAADRLERLGYAVTRGVGGTGVVGVLANGEGPTVLIRSDMDALPVTEETGLPYCSKVTTSDPDGRNVGVMHACGHDVHQVCLVGTASVLAATRDRWRGTVVAVAQPAEEIGAGARMMIEDGLFERFPRPDYCLSLHVASELPADSIGFTSGWAMANVDSVDITVYGEGGHGSRPDTTIDPVVAAAQVVTALQTIVSRRVDPVDPAVVTVGSIHGGSKHNIIPNEVRMQLTVRSYGDATRRLLLDSIHEVTVGTCRAMGCTRDPEVSIAEGEYTPASYNDPELTEAAVRVMGHVVGEDNIIERRPRMTGEDFGRYARHLDVPGFMFWLGSVEAGKYETSREGGVNLPSLHSSKYAPDAERTIETGVRCMASTVLSLLDPSG